MAANDLIEHHPTSDSDLFIHNDFLASNFFTPFLHQHNNYHLDHIRQDHSCDLAVVSDFANNNNDDNPFAVAAAATSSLFDANADISTVNVPSLPSLFGQPDRLIPPYRDILNGVSPASPTAYLNRDILPEFPTLPYQCSSESTFYMPWSGSPWGQPLQSQQHHDRCPYAPPSNQQHPPNPSFLTFHHNRNHHQHISPVAQTAPSLPTPPPTLPNLQPHNATQSVQAQPDDNYYLSTLVHRDFSSPSLPPIGSSPRNPPSEDTPERPKPREIGQGMPGAPRRRQRSTRGASSGHQGVVDLTKEEPSTANSGIDSTAPTLTMPPTTRRQSSAQNAGGASAGSRKRHRTPAGSSSPSKRSAKIRRRYSIAHDSSSVFGDDDAQPADALESIDLSNATGVPDELMAPKVDNRTKLGKFQCIICMDDVTALTVTHCGHLFCSECLHSALHIDTMKRACPVCRSKVDSKDKKTKGTKSFFHLELKVMTATKKGKRPAG
ncbi:hypothetical protein F5Y15DRAFT_419590 [Xylariaceae sp. FL0016]|nr:hypothetical protein F5Y15DRAFT_419590 [Xylariaceae sp. FL0016]